MWNELSREERTRRVREGAAAGLSTAKIAAGIGGVTRSAVIGWARRYGIGLAFNPGAQKKREKKVEPTIRLKTTSRKPLPAATVVEVAKPRLLTLIELTETLCHWPEGDPRDEDFRFCGADVALGRRYCAAHARIAYIPAAGRKRRAA